MCRGKASTTRSFGEGCAKLSRLQASEGEGRNMRLAFKYAFIAIPVMLSLAAPVAAGSGQDAMAAYAKGDYATALRLLRPLADQGDAQAQI